MDEPSAYHHLLQATGENTLVIRYEKHHYDTKNRECFLGKHKSEEPNMIDSPEHIQEHVSECFLKVAWILAQHKTKHLLLRGAHNNNN